MRSRYESTVPNHALPIRYIPINGLNAYAADAPIFLAGRFDRLIHIQSTSPEAPMNDLDHSVLLFQCHLVVAGQAQASAENVRADVYAGPGDVSVALPSAVAFHCDKSIGAVDRLH